MVQMKERLKHLIRNSANILYIPHGSDERGFIVNAMKKTVSLYIPHGSDERASSSNAIGEITVTFISHMVQMKGEIRDLFLKCQKLYIPHGSDERLIALIIIEAYLAALYPTWFR